MKPTRSRWLQVVKGSLPSERDKIRTLGFRESKSRPSIFYRFVAANGMHEADKELAHLSLHNMRREWRSVRRHKARRRAQAAP